MKKNKLYQFIHNEIDNPEYSLKTSLENHAYALRALPNSRLQTVTDGENQSYRITSHHISFYAKYDDRDPNVSFYHYTAILHDAEDKKYQLHVYFNKKGQIVKEPVLSLEEASHSTRQHLSQELRDSLNELALEHTLQPMAELYQQFHQKRIQLEAHYAGQEQQLATLAENFAQNAIAYQACLRQTIALAEELSDYDDESKYQNIALFLRRIDAVLQIPPAITSGVKTNTSEQVTENKSTSSASSTSSTASIQTTFVKTNPVDKIIQKALAAKSHYLAAQKLSAKERLPFFLKLHKYSTDALMAAEDSKNLNAQQLQTIQSLFSSIQNEGSELLRALLLKNEFTSALQLHQHLGPIQDKLAQMAIAVGNASLLDFILTHGNVAIDTLVIKDNLSPVQYCLQKHSEKTPKTACLSVLIKHNASVMVKAPDGLPVAHHILSVEDHPLRAAFKNKENASKTIGYQPFINKLIRSLSNALRHDDMTDAEKSKLESDITDYRVFYSSENKAGLQLIGNPAMDEKIDALFSQATEENNPELNEDDGVYQLHLMLFKQSLDAYQEKLTPLQRRQQAHEDAELIEDICASTKLPEILASKNPRKQIITIFTDCRKYVDLQSELLDIQYQITHLPVGRRNANKMESLQRKILDEAEVYQTRYPFLKGKEALAEINKKTEKQKEKAAKKAAETPQASADNTNTPARLTR